MSPSELAYLMKERKVQLTGGSTLTVSLPKEWATEADVEAGDTLRLFPDGTRLVIESAHADDDTKETAVAVAGATETEVRRMILAFYTSGFNSVTLTDPTGFDQTRRVITDTTRKLIGLEIVNATETEVTLKNLLNSSTVSVGQSTEQMQQLALAMHEDAVMALLEGDQQAASRVSERDDQVDRLYAMVSRHFQRALENPVNAEELDLGRLELYDYQTTARQFERIADHAVKLAGLGPRFEQPLPPDLARQIKNVGDSSRDIATQAAATLLADGETEAAHAALDRRDALLEDIAEIERTLHEEEIPQSHLIALVLDSLTRTAEYGGNIAETSLNAAARTEEL
ncbi:PhoU domain-containing protein [Halovenus halobia]|uniref:PhoU domain-containing protein n=1 Tax=Halovenus halobia TaxID=3396622 RepID=UPI003F56786F